MDGDVNGGLVNDPVLANSGIAPLQISSPVDFDGDGCADYPYKPNPQSNTQTGKCYRDGVNPPAGW